MAATSRPPPAPRRSAQARCRAPPLATVRQRRHRAMRRVAAYPRWLASSSAMKRRTRGPRVAARCELAAGATGRPPSPRSRIRLLDQCDDATSSSPENRCPHAASTGRAFGELAQRADVAGQVRVSARRGCPTARNPRDGLPHPGRQETPMERLVRRGHHATNAPKRPRQRSATAECVHRGTRARSPSSNWSGPADGRRRRRRARPLARPRSRHVTLVIAPPCWRRADAASVSR